VEIPRATMRNMIASLLCWGVIPHFGVGASVGILVGLVVGVIVGI